MSDDAPLVSATASAPAKVNLALYVGSPDLSGFHPLLTAFQGLDLRETVRVTLAPETSIICEAPFDTSGVPLDESNIVWRALSLFTQPHSDARSVLFRIEKRIPVAGGMAGGSADAAASLVALNELFQTGYSHAQLFEMARELGSDVPFSLLGGSAIGRGRGDQLESLSTEDSLHLVIVPSTFELSTPAVYRELDTLRGESELTPPAQLSVEFLAAWRAGDADALAPLMHNDLEPAALRLAPSLLGVLKDVEHAGALRAIVSGSGPTVIGVARSAQHAGEVANRLRTSGYQPLVTQTSPRAAELDAPLFQD